MPRTGRLSGGRDALALLRLASNVSLDSFLALKRAAASTVSIVEETKKFRWDRKDWDTCALFIESAVINVIQFLGAQDPPQMEDVRHDVDELAKALEQVEAGIHKLQQARGLRRIRIFRNDRQSIRDMKTQIDATLVPFRPLPDAPGVLSESESEQVFARIIERYRDGMVIAISSNHSSASVANQNPSPIISNNDHPVLPATVCQ
ncbi:hypothetical protein FIBSPDRAFT_74867 [Athelia psychrophila]|uniref:Uncharacterized protein n=1 Tax=Athelia psychrophila TaxID=1759441 RepID=A0A166EJB3_9AGAM|nr:hypothetical protein FIBSPDRAFT_74867 [Fibularhizoctonia sp. CBS 109695]